MHPLLICLRTVTKSLLETLIGAFATLQEAFETLQEGTISFVMPIRPSVRPSVRMKQLGFHWTDFCKILFWRIFRKSVEKNQV
jgi:hypothetical protein